MRVHRWAGLHVNITINFSEVFLLEKCLREAEIEANLKFVFNMVETGDETSISLHASLDHSDMLVEKGMPISLKKSIIVSCQQDSR